MGKDIVICCDGTGNEIGRNLSNVLKLFRCLVKNDEQRVYYSAGIGTIGQQNAWQRFKQKARGVFGLVTGHGLDDDVVAAYRFLCLNHVPGDRIWLFGFSRGAYTVRVLAAFTHVMGLLPRDQLNLAGYAFSAYKNASAEDRRATRKTGAPTGVDAEKSEALQAAWQFSRVAGGDPVRFEFVGVWDTVASILVPRSDRLAIDMQTLRFTRTNPSIKTFRQAIAIDERRRMFRLNPWRQPQPHRTRPFDQSSEIAQDIRQVAFAGVHADIGGGYPETESALSKFPLTWMIEQAAAKGLRLNRAMVNHLAYGIPRKGSTQSYVPPDATGELHKSLTAGWWPLEVLPRNVRWRETRRWSLLGWYIPFAEPRLIPTGALVHASLVERMSRLPDYRPVNLPDGYEIEALTPPPQAKVAARRGGISASPPRLRTGTAGQTTAAPRDAPTAILDERK